MEENYGQEKSQPYYISGKAYTVLKFLALVLLPAVAALYFNLGHIWDFPKTEEVLGTIASVETFLGLMLGLSNANYNKSDSKYDGLVVIDKSDPLKDVVTLDIGDTDPRDNKQVLLKVVETR